VAKQDRRCHRAARPLAWCREGSPPGTRGLESAERAGPGLPSEPILASRPSRHAPGAQRCVSRRVLYRCCSTALSTAPRCGRPPRRSDLDGSTEELRQIATPVTPSWRRPPGSQRAHGIRPCNPCRLGVERPGMLILAGDGRSLPLDYGELERWSRVGYEWETAMHRGER
jgi:hypothetical protein